MKSSTRIKTKYTGVFYREIHTNNKPDKTYYIRFKDNNQKVQEVKVGKYSEGIRENFCNKKRIHILNELRHGNDFIPNNKKKRETYLNSLATFYFDHKKVHWSERNFKKSQSLYNLHIQPYFEKTPIQDINKQLLLKFQSDKLISGLSAKSVNNILSMLMAILHFCIEYEKVDIIIPHIKKLSIDNARERFLDINEIQLLLEQTKDTPTLFLFCKLALTTGARLSSILNIQKKDIDLTNNQINIKDFKNNTTYKAFLAKDLVNFIKKYIQNLESNTYIIGAKKVPVADTTITKFLRVIFDELFNSGLKKDDRKNRVVTHTLRHTFASHLAINGTPIYTIQKLMNHKDIKMTLRYAKLAPDTGKSAVDSLYQQQKIKV